MTTEQLQEEVKQLKDKVAELEKSELKSRIWLENSPVCTKIVDLDFNLQYMSSSGVKELKIKDITEYYGTPYPLSFYPDSFKIPMTNNLKKVKETSKIITQEAAIVDVDGNELWYHSTLVPVHDNKGKLDYIMVVSLKTTERKKIEHELFDNEKLYRLMTENSTDTIWLMQLDGTFLYHSPAVMQLRGYTPEEANKVSMQKSMTPQSIKFLDKLFAREDAKPMKERWNSLRFELEMFRKDGSKIWTEVSAKAVFDDEDQMVGIQGATHNITDRKEAEKNLLESLKREKVQADTVRNTPIAIAFGYPDGSLDNCNNAFCDLTGYTEDELLKINWSEVLTPEKWRKNEVEELNKLNPKNSYIRYEKEYIHKNGTIIPIELLVTAKYINKNQIDHYIAFITNISERKLSETKIKAERDKLTSIFESMTDGVYIANKEYDIEYVNPILIKDFGLPGNKKCHKYFHNSDEPCTFCKNEDIFAGKSVQWEWTSPKNGKTYDLIDTPIKNSDGSISKLEIFRDITDRKESENKIARFSHIFEDSLNEIYLFDADTLIFTQVNNAAQDNLGYSMDELRNMTPLDLKLKFTAELFAQIIEPLRKGKKQKIIFETVHQRKDRSLYNVEVHLQLLQFEKENVFVAFIMDITERKLAENELTKHRERLEHLVNKRTVELEEKNQELDHTLKVFVGREYKINELQEKIRALEKE